MPLHARSSGEQLYVRQLPSGGYVAIEAETVRPLFAAPKIRVHVLVERRPDGRREGHAPPIAACAEGDDVNAMVAALMPIAESDQAIHEVFARGATIPIAPKR
jgi:hypothetical protein